MLRLSSVFLRIAAAVLLVLPALTVRAQPAGTTNAPMAIEGLGKGTAPIDGPWRFHVGDNPAWAAPGFDDSGWQRVTADEPWGMQGHDRYTGYAWYRCRLKLTPAPGVPAQFALLIQQVDDAYEIYWNGRLVGRNGRLEPVRIWYYSQPPQTFRLGSAESGVLAVRVWKAPLFSDDSGQDGGFESAPLIGSPAAIAAVRDALEYQWLHGEQFVFGENLLYAAIALLSLLAWMRNRHRWLLFWMAAFAAQPPLILLFVKAEILWPYVLAMAVVQPLFAIQDISLWFLLLWLLPLREDRRLCRLTRILACISLTSSTLDGLLLAIHWGPHWIGAAQIADGLAALIFTVLDAFPLVLVTVALTRRHRFNFARWLVAILAFLDDMVFVVRNAVKQGRQFTNWNLAAKIDAPLFRIGGSAISLHTLTGTLLLVAIVYAVYSRLREDQRQKAVLEREKAELTRTREQMRHFAEHDDLTGLWNHRIIMERLAGEVDRSRRDRTPLSVILADIDYFKSINDNYGHPAGDLVLKEVSAIFMRSVRNYDWVGRYGGEEFLIILPGSGFESACMRAEELRKAVQSAHIVDGESSLRVTSSFGVATGFPLRGEAEVVIRAVDAALYQAKKNGRNCVVATDMTLTAEQTEEGARHTPPAVPLSEFEEEEAAG